MCVGRIDAAIRWRQSKQLWCLDYKTAGEVSARLFANFHSCPQAVLYTTAMSIMTGERAQGLVVEAVRVSKVNDEVFPALIFVSDTHIEQMKQLFSNACNAIERYNCKGEWPQNRAMCASYSSFGSAGYYCQYEQLCDASDWHEAERFFARRKPYHPFRYGDSE